jgi:hypothetical protein
VSSSRIVRCIGRSSVLEIGTEQSLIGLHEIAIGAVEGEEPMNATTANPIRHGLHGERCAPRTHRRLILGDIENTLGMNPIAASKSYITEVTYAVRQIVRPTPGDQVILACNPRIVTAVVEGWPDAEEVRSRWGQNGADSELVEAASSERLGRCGELWLLSGDKAFLEVARRAKLSGLRVVVVARPEQTHRRLGMTAHQFIPFGAPEEKVAG